MRAALRGVIDFREARVLDVSWWRRLNILLREMEREDQIKITQAQLLKYCAFIANGNLEESDFKGIQEKAQESIRGLITLIYPWFDSEKDKTKVLDDLTSLWTAHFGDWNDPAVQERIKEGIRLNDERLKEVRRETDEQMVARKIRERARR